MARPPHIWRSFTTVLAWLLAILSPGLAHAQAGGAGTSHPDSRTELYGGYAYFHPVNSGIFGYQYQDVYNLNATVSVAAFANRYVGLKLEGGYLSGSNQHRPYTPGCAQTTCDQLVYTAQAGPVFRLPLGSWIPFVHMLGGGARYNGPVNQQLKWGWGVTGGIGVDYVLPFFNDHLAVRPLQADFQYSQVVYGPLVLPSGTRGGFGEIDALKMSGGLVLRFGDIQPPKLLELGCTAQSYVHPGEPLTVTGSTVNLKPNVQPEWHWETTGGHLKANENVAEIDTTGLAPGEYTVRGSVVDGRRAKDRAACAVAFAVQPVEPPSLTCSALPSTVMSGTEVEISTTGISPGNRPLHYTYTATAGALTPNGPTAKLSTAGLGATNIGITCNVEDDLGQKATYGAQVIVKEPAQPVIPVTQELCSLSFNRDRRRPARVDNEAKGCLDDIALILQQRTDAKLVMIGNASPDEHPVASAQRVLNARQYLTEEKGVEPGRIQVRVGMTSGRTVRNVLVPAGSTFADRNAQPFEEKNIVRKGEAYGRHRAPRRYR